MTSDLKARLLAEYPYKIELHAHTTPASSCSDVTPRELAEIYHAQGFSAVTVTNHFVFREGREKKEVLEAYLADYEQTRRAGEALGLRVYLGAEIRFTENVNDYLVYGVSAEILSEIYDLLPLGLENFKRALRFEHSLLIQAHPARNRMTPVDTKHLDGMEVYNLHPNHNSRIGLVSRYAADSGMRLMTAGSDFHHKGLGHEGLAALLSKTLPIDSFELAHLLSERDYLFSLGAGELLLP